ncbi:cysteine desulfurase [Bradyrhizobium sp. i1.3.6]
MNLRSAHDRSAVSVARPIYLDHHSTTPVDRRVAEVMVRAMTEHFGNPNNPSHFFGEDAARLVATARTQVAALVDADEDDVIFARSTTVAARAIIEMIVEGRTSERRPRLAATTIEHAAILDTLERLETQRRAEIVWLPVDKRGNLTDDAVELALQSQCDLICVMAANNEVGTIYPIGEISDKAAASRTPVLVDATQAAGHVPLDVRGWGVTYLLMSAHKMYGPKGIAALIANGVESDDLRRLEVEDGTPNVPAIVGFGEACRLRGAEMESDYARVGGLRDKLEALLLSRIPHLVVNGDRLRRLPTNLHVSIPGLPNDAIVARLSGSVAISTGAACRWGTDEPSHVLRAMKLPPETIEGALRLGLGRNTRLEDVELAADLIVAAVEETRAAIRGA